MCSNNPYLDQIQQILPRVLAFFDMDPTSQSYGVGDRFHWAWGVIDFGNGTFQSTAHGIARLWRNGLWPLETSSRIFVRRIDAIFQGAKYLTRKDGSLEEAFPNEGSYCVTSLVAFDLLCTIELMQDADVPKTTLSAWRAVIAPMIRYLIAGDETHALISNHLATAVGALVRWHKLTGDTGAEKKAKLLLDRILLHQSNEGWFKEYEGADPGYQTLCTYYLADVHRIRPDWNLREPLASSVRFLWHFAHPDGSFGGLYGSRNTRFYYPAGLEALAEEIPESAALARHMVRSIATQSVVTLACMDDPNLIPMFNSYCCAAISKAARIETEENDSLIPALKKKSFRHYFQNAGLLIDSGPSHYTVVSTHKGGVVYHFLNGQLAVLNAGVVVQGPRGQFGSGQVHAPSNEVQIGASSLDIRTSISIMPKLLPTPSQFLVLRVLCISIFRFRKLREFAKRMLVVLLITRRKAWPVTNTRRIRLGSDLSISDSVQAPAGYTHRDTPVPFAAIHMASQGYWQRQDDET